MGCAVLTATVTATAATHGNQQRSSTARNARAIRANWAYVRPEKQTVEARSPLYGNLASDEETAGSIRPPGLGLPPASLFSHRLPHLMVVSDFGSRMGATMSAQLRLDALIVAAGRFLTSPDIGFRLPVTGRLCVVVIDVAVRTASRSAGRPRRPLSLLSWPGAPVLGC
jgi:hypothetical protein